MTQLKPEEFPILCETCLGENPYLRMTQEKWGKECKICSRPFTIYRWKPGPRARFKKTEVCRTCAKLKNVCQTCILDLRYNLPVQVRDSVLTSQQKEDLITTMPISSTNRNYLYEQIEHNTGLGRENGLQLPYDKITSNPFLNSLQRKGPYYKRNLPHICSFYVKGTCNRGNTCPYRHVLPEKNSLSDQNIKDRFYGVNDPVAKKMLMRSKQENINNKKREIPPPPVDTNIRTLWIGGINDIIQEDDISYKFSQFGNIISVDIIREKKCAFITFSDRNSAQLAINTLFDNLFIKNFKFKLDWGKTKNNNNNKNINNNINNNNINNNNINTINNKLTNEEISYLKSKGLNKPIAPILPDPVVAPPPPGMHPLNNKNNDNREYNYYSSMLSHYKENAINPNLTKTNE